jgi:hypothetical protein
VGELGGWVGGFFECSWLNILRRFFVTAALPIGITYAAEVTAPTPESISNGLIQLVGSVSFVFVFIMQAMAGDAGDFTSAMLLCVAMLVLSAILICFMRDVASEEVALTTGSGGLLNSDELESALSE